MSPVIAEARPGLAPSGRGLLTGRQFVALIFESGGHRPKISVASRPMIRLAGPFSSFLRELNETLYQFDQPLDVRRIEV
jgi:hypothetical protein